MSSKISVTPRSQRQMTLQRTIMCLKIGPIELNYFLFSTESIVFSNKNKIEKIFNSFFFIAFEKKVIWWSFHFEDWNFIWKLLHGSLKKNSDYACEISCFRLNYNIYLNFFHTTFEEFLKVSFDIKNRFPDNLLYITLINCEAFKWFT